MQRRRRKRGKKEKKKEGGKEEKKGKGKESLTQGCSGGQFYITYSKRQCTTL
jgi:hypothetical protein